MHHVSSVLLALLGAALELTSQDSHNVACGGPPAEEPLFQGDVPCARSVESQGRQLTWNAPDSQLLLISEGRGYTFEFGAREVETAWFGAGGHGWEFTSMHGKDVTGKLLRLLSRSSDKTVVASTQHFGDTAPGFRKELAVWLRPSGAAASPSPTSPPVQWVAPVQPSPPTTTPQPSVRWVAPVQPSPPTTTPWVQTTPWMQWAPPPPPSPPPPPPTTTPWVQTTPWMQWVAPPPPSPPPPPPPPPVPWLAPARPTEKNDEIEFTNVDFAVAEMLLGTVLFVIVLFLLANHSDSDIRRYSWSTISTTISIFTAVLMFNGVNEMVLFLIEGHGALLVCLMQYVHFLFWILCLQASMGTISGAVLQEHLNMDRRLQRELWVINDSKRVDHEEEVDEAQVRNPKAQKSTAVVRGMRVPVMKRRMEYERRRRWMRCYGSLLAHMAGFAGINAGGTMQHLPMFSQSPERAMVPVLLQYMLVMAFFKGANVMRQHLHSKALRVQQSRCLGPPLVGGLAGADAEVVQASFGSHWAEPLPTYSLRHRLYDEETREAENEISCLAISFLTVQVLRFAITGMLPDISGEDPQIKKHSTGCIYSLYAVAGVSALLTILSASLACEAEADEESTDCERLGVIVMNTTAMMFSWSVLFATRWLAERLTVLEDFGMGLSTMMGRVALAMCLSLAALGLVRTLDTVDDLYKENEASEGAGQLLLVIIKAIAILVGFSWEYAFHFGVEVISAMTPKPLLSGLALACFVFWLIVPPWRKLILKHAMQLEDYHKESKLAFQRWKSGAVSQSFIRS